MRLAALGGLVVNSWVLVYHLAVIAAQGFVLRVTPTFEVHMNRMSEGWPELAMFFALTVLGTWFFIDYIKSALSSTTRS